VSITVPEKGLIRDIFYAFCDELDESISTKLEKSSPESVYCFEPQKTHLTKIKDLDRKYYTFFSPTSVIPKTVTTLVLRRISGKSQIKKFLI
jgi:hypothetical protein